MPSDMRFIGQFSPRPSLAALAGVFVVSLVVSATVAGAQTRFEPSKAIANPATYGTIEECIAVGRRLSDSIQKSFYQDTAQWTREEQSQPVPPAIVNALGSCSRFFDVATAPLTEWKLFTRLLLMSGRESDARALVARRLAAIPATAERERVLILDSLILFYLTEIKPPQFTAVDTILAILASIPPSAQPWTERIDRERYVFNVVQTFRDTVRLKQSAERIVAISETLTEADRNTPFFKDVATGVIYFALEYLSYREALDSLRKGDSKALLRAKLKNFERTTRQPAENFPFPIGFPAPPIAGMWFQEGGKPMSTPVSRPTRGRISLVVFYSYLCYQYKKCLGSYATLQRLHKRYPELEINIVADYTTGFFGPRLLTDTLAEAKMLADYWLGYHKLPAALAVEPSTFWRLPDPDRRRQNQIMSNPEAYRHKLGVQEHMAPAESFLIDRDGTIVEWFPQGVNRETEWDFVVLLDILMSR